MTNTVETPPTTPRLDEAHSKIENLELALQSSRMIGMALGIVMERCRLSERDAFELLVHVSQRTHRKLRDIAEELVFSGVIPDAA